MPYNKTLVIDEITDDGAGQVTVPTILEANRINASVGDGGFVANLAGTEVGTAGNINMNATLQLASGPAALLGAGGAIQMDGSTGEITLNEGSQLIAHGVPKIREFTLNFSDYLAPSTTAFFDYTVESSFDWIVLDWFVRQTQDFIGGALSAVEMLLGSSTAPSGYCPAGQVDLFSGAPVVNGLLVSNRGPLISTFGTHVLQTGASDAVRVTLNATGANLDQLSQGTASIYVRYFTLPN